MFVLISVRINVVKLTQLSMDTIIEAMNWSGWMAIIWRMHDPVKLKSFVCCRYHHFLFLPNVSSFFFSLSLSLNVIVLRSCESNLHQYESDSFNEKKLICCGGVALVTLIYFVLDRHKIDRIISSCDSFGNLFDS